MLVAEIWPAATLVSCRSLPGEPKLTTPTGDAPANWPSVIDPNETDETGTAAVVTVEPAPRATELAIDTAAPLPIATPLLTDAVLA